jgi:hypothetical protein
MRLQVSLSHFSTDPVHSEGRARGGSISLQRAGAWPDHHRLGQSARERLDTRETAVFEFA